MIPTIMIPTIMIPTMMMPTIMISIMIMAIDSDDDNDDDNDNESDNDNGDDTNDDARDDDNDDNDDDNDDNDDDTYDEDNHDDNDCDNDDANDDDSACSDEGATGRPAKGFLRTDPFPSNFPRLTNLKQQAPKLQNPRPHRHFRPLCSYCFCCPAAQIKFQVVVFWGGWCLDQGV